MHPKTREAYLEEEKESNPARHSQRETKVLRMMQSDIHSAALTKSESKVSGRHQERPEFATRARHSWRPLTESARVMGTNRMSRHDAPPPHRRTREAQEHCGRELVEERTSHVRIRDGSLLGLRCAAVRGPWPWTLHIVILACWSQACARSVSCCTVVLVFSETACEGRCSQVTKRNLQLCLLWLSQLSVV